MKRLALIIMAAYLHCPIALCDMPGDSFRSGREGTTAHNSSIVKLTSMCNLDNIAAGPLTIEGQSESDPNRIFINETFRFESAGMKEVTQGKKLQMIRILETMEIGFFHDWISEGISALGPQVRAGLGESCRNSLGNVTSVVTGYNPPSGRINASATKRECSSMDFPCGSPELTCRGGRLCCPTEAPTCHPTIPMCRGQLVQPVFSVDATVEFAMHVSLIGAPPQQQLKMNHVLTRNDASSSQGEVLKLFRDIGLTDVLGIRIGEVERTFQQNVNDYSRALQAGAASFNMPSADFVYLPNSKAVRWSSPTARPAGSAPFGLLVERETELPLTFACKLVNCINQSKAAGSLLIKSCVL